jgi:hypothetical protein
MSLLSTTPPLLRRYFLNKLAYNSFIGLLCELVEHLPK